MGMTDDTLDLATATEEELRDNRDKYGPHPKTEEELLAIIHALAEREHTYGTCVYAMSMSAVAAFNYISHKLGVTGFQASCADLDILKMTRQFQWGKVINYDDLLFPQYESKFKGWDWLLQEHAEKLAELAKEKLEESPDAHPNVVAHWKRLAGEEK